MLHTVSILTQVAFAKFERLPASHPPANARAPVPSAMEPSQDECSACTTIQNVADWVGIAGDATDPNTSLGHLMVYLGVTGVSHWRILAAIPEQAFELLPDSWQPNGAAPLPGLRGQLGLLGRACRITGGTSSGFRSSA